MLKLNTTLPSTKWYRQEHASLGQKCSLVKLDKLHFIHDIIKNLIDINKSVRETLPNKVNQEDEDTTKHSFVHNSLYGPENNEKLRERPRTERSEEFKEIKANIFLQANCLHDKITTFSCSSTAKSKSNATFVIDSTFNIINLIRDSDTVSTDTAQIIVNSQQLTKTISQNGRAVKFAKKSNTNGCPKLAGSAKKLSLVSIRIDQKSEIKNFARCPEWQNFRLKSAKLIHPAQRRRTLDLWEISLIRTKFPKFVPRWRTVEGEGEEEEVEAAEAEEAPVKPKGRPSHRKDEEQAEVKELSEAEKALLAQKKKHEADDAEKMKEYEEQRRIQREKDEEELRLLKEKQERRRQEREEEERVMSERRKEDEDRRKAEEEQRRAKAESDKKRKEEDKRKKQAMMAGLQASATPNFELPKRDATQDKFDKFGNIMKAKAEMGETKQQHEEQKKKYLADMLKAADFSGLDVSALKAKVKEMHQRICKLEALKYDLEQRQVRQDYDLKEMNERQRQISRNKALKKGIDPEEATASRHPPKLPVASKYDRQIDRRSYGDRRDMFESPKAAKEKSIFHGSSRPPNEWGRRTNNEELENIRKNLEPPKYVEAVKVEGAKPPMDAIPTQAPGDEEEED